jgi:acylpyruvate hydrolase
VRLATVRTAAGTRAARVEGEDVILLGDPDIVSLLSHPDWRVRAMENGGKTQALDKSDLAPVVRPLHVFGVGLNYRSHITEMGRELPAHPTLFAKFADSLTGPRDDILLPTLSQQVDWEGELGVVVGCSVRHADLDTAAAAIAGFTVVNDISMRDWQWRTSEWLQGKAFEESTPVGPVLVTADDVGGAKDLLLTTEVDGVLMQRASTADLLFGPADLISYVSQFMTLRPGDLISTGTPAGVGSSRNPNVFLRSGQIVSLHIEGIGSCVNRCIAEKPSTPGQS